MTTLERGLEYTEYVSSNNLLGALSEFYSRFGYKKIIKIVVTNI